MARYEAAAEHDNELITGIGCVGAGKNLKHGRASRAPKDQDRRTKLW